MNTDNLHELIKQYENDIDRIYNAEHDELFKWRAFYVWRKEWFRPADAFASFADRFNAARKEFSLFIDNSRMHPSSGVFKLWEKEPATVENLFQNILLADNNGSVSQGREDEGDRTAHTGAMRPSSDRHGELADIHPRRAHARSCSPP